MTALSKSNSASEVSLTLIGGTGITLGNGGGCTFAVAEAGATGIGAGATTATGSGLAANAPSQRGSAVAGVQLESRQHSPAAFFQTSPEADFQLLEMVCACVSPAKTIAVAITASLPVPIILFSVRKI
jgi:hypothetical protein